ncbi:MAG: DUF3857 domain-containing protein [Deferribacteres bacterium]|nr:DUF3857 domain-containing protein [Deferribacteres bacterium]
MKINLKIVVFFAVAVSRVFGQTYINESRILSSKTTILIEDEDKITVQEKSRIVIAEEDKKDYAGDQFTESKFARLKKMDAMLIGVDGQKIKSLDEDDIQESSISYYSIYNEHKTKFYSLAHPQLPYIVEKYKEYELKSLFFLPHWDPQWGGVNVENASLEIIVEKPVKFKHVNIGGVDGPQISVDDSGNKHYIWQVKNVAAYKTEYRRAPEAMFQVGVKLFAEEFSLDGYHGSSASWEKFGNWYADLVGTRSQFPVAIDEFRKYLSLPVRERIQCIYRYLQEKTRYVQIYMGIDGWQPHPVVDIHKNQYGDCKDLSIYMIAMLEQAGVKAYPALALPRSYGWVDERYPGNQFNHCIAVVPLPEDTLWLECTSDVAAYNDATASLEGVNLLFVKKGESRLIRTPLSSADANKSVFKADVKLTAGRKAELHGKALFYGNRAAFVRGALWTLEPDKQKKWLASIFAENAGDVKITTLNIINRKETDAPLELEFNVLMNYFARKAGQRLIFTPRLFHTVAYDGEAPENRTMPLLNSGRFMDLDTISFSIPFGFEPKQQSDTDSLISPFGSFRCSKTSSPEKITWTSSFRLNAREVPLEVYPEYHNFMNDAQKMSEAKLVLMKIR